MKEYVDWRCGGWCGKEVIKATRDKGDRERGVVNMAMVSFALDMIVATRYVVNK